MVVVVALLVIVVVEVAAPAGAQAVSNHSREAECIEGSTGGRTSVVFPALGPIWYTTSAAGTIALYPSDEDGSLFGGGTDATTPSCQPEEWGKITSSPRDSYSEQVVFHLCGGGTETRSLEKSAGLGVWSEHPIQWSSCEPPGVAASAPSLRASAGEWVTAVVLVAAALVALVVFCSIRRRRGGFPCRRHGLRGQKDPEDPHSTPSVPHASPTSPEPLSAAPQPQPSAAVPQPTTPVPEPSSTTVPGSPTAVPEPLTAAA